MRTMESELYDYGEGPPSPPRHLASHSRHEWDEDPDFAAVELRVDAERTLRANLRARAAMERELRAEKRLGRYNRNLLKAYEPFEFVAHGD